MSAFKVSKEEVGQVYESLRKIEVAQIDHSKMGEWAKSNNSPFTGNVLKDNFQLLHKLARNSTVAQFTDFVIEGEMPATKLTAKEMESIKGGLSPYIVGYSLVILADFIYKNR